MRGMDYDRGRPPPPPSRDNRYGYAEGNRGARQPDRSRDHYSSSRPRDGDDRGDREHYRRDRSRSRSSERYRDEDRYKDRDRDRRHSENRGRGEGSDYQGTRDYYDQPFKLNPVSSTVIIKGLPAHTTEPAGTGECKGFAFVQFYSPEYAEYFMNAYAGSWGDVNAPQLIIENRAVALDYARDEPPGAGHYGHGGPQGAPPGARGGGAPAKSDWLCDACGCQNFARRQECYKCNLPRGENAIVLSAIVHGEPMVDPSAVSESPCATLVVKGLPPLAGEEQIMEVFRQYAVVSNVLIMRDWATNISRGIAFVEFQSVEHAVHAKSQSSDLRIGSQLLKVGYARPGYQKFFQHQNTGAIANSYALAALQAAQWSSNNAYQPAPASVAMTHMPTVNGGSAALRIKSRQWPPNFETEGAAYHFQPQSGCFLDPISQYYYCPRSKTYYNASNGEYYKYVGGTDPENLFQKIVIQEPSGKEPPVTDDTTTQSSSALPSSRKPVVLSMGLSSKAKGKNTPIMPSVIEVKQSSDAVPATLLASNNSSAFAKIAKWEERRRQEADPEIAMPGASDVSSAAAQPSASSAAPAATPAVCLLCRRQFASVEVLRRHELESKLHAENLAKSKAAESSKYRDRASERRIMHPDEEELNKSESREKPSAVENKALAPPPAPPVSLDKDVSNPGNTLLRRMGWSDGAGLGKDGSGSVVPVAYDKSASASLAPGEKTGVGVSDRIPALVYGDGNEYKESLLRAARARYEAVSKQDGEK